jgi:hypothetical protein
MRQGTMALWPFMRMIIEIAGMSPKMKIRKARRWKIDFDMASNAETPILSCKNS